MHSRIDKFGAIKDRPGPDACGQGAVDVLELHICGRRDGSAVAADQHEDGAKDHFASVHARAAGLQFAPDRYLCQILDPHRHSRPGGDDDLADFSKPLDAAAGPHHVAFAVALDEIRASADIVRCNSVGYLAEGEPVSDQPRRVWLNNVLLDVPAYGVGTGDARNRLHLRSDNPVLDGAQIDNTLQRIGETFSL